METVIVLVPEGLSTNYYVYALNHSISTSAEANAILKWKGRIRLGNVESSYEAIMKIIERYEPEAIGLRVIYGGEEFDKFQVLYDCHVLNKLKKLQLESPLHISPVIRLLNIITRVVPTPTIFLFFETAFFVHLPVQEQRYALVDRVTPMSFSSTGCMRRYGYHGLLHELASNKIARQHRNARRILSICLDPIPEVAAIYDKRPIMVSSGSTPLEGLPGNTTCGDIDPGVILLIQEKTSCCPQGINEILTKKSGLSAIIGNEVTIDEIFGDNASYNLARNIFEHRLLLNCGSAIGFMNGVDAVCFSGRYQKAAKKMCAWLLAKITSASARGARPFVLFVRDSPDRIIAEACFSSLKQIETDNSAGRFVNISK